MTAFSPLLLAILSWAQAAEYPLLMSMEELVDAADDIVHGHVVELRSVSQESGLITTDVVLDLEDAFDDGARSRVVLSTPGGEKDGVRLSVPGAPEFAIGDEVVVLAREGKIVGLGQGLFSRRDNGLMRPAMPSDAQFTASVAGIMGDRAQTIECLKESRRIAIDEGWSSRGALNSGLLANTARGVAVSLIEGLEYKLGLCVDGHAQSTLVTVYDPAGRLVADAEVTEDTGFVELVPEQTGQYLVAVESGSMQTGVWRSRFGLNISYR